MIWSVKKDLWRLQLVKGQVKVRKEVRAVRKLSCGREIPRGTLEAVLVMEHQVARLSFKSIQEKGHTLALLYLLLQALLLRPDADLKISDTRILRQHINKIGAMMVSKNLNVKILSRSWLNPME